MLPVPHTDQVEIRILECVNNISLGDGGRLWIRLPHDTKTARTRRGPNKSLLIYLHPFSNFTRIDLGHGSGRALSKGRHNGCKCGVEFQSNHFPNWLVTLP
jgi:hypothetical protein